MAWTSHAQAVGPMGRKEQEEARQGKKDAEEPATMSEYVKECSLSAAKTGLEGFVDGIRSGTKAATQG